MKQKNLILIDANNFFFRAYLAPPLTTNGEPIEIVYSIFKNLIKTIENIRNFSNIDNDIIAFCYDRGYNKRTQISIEAVNNRIIPMTYKSKRRIVRCLEKRNMCEQDRQLQERKRVQLDKFFELCQITRCNQVFLPGQEADDIIASYTNKYKDVYNIFVVTNDKDYYQLLDDITIYNSKDDIFVTKEKFKSEYEFSTSEQFIDYGAIMGDTSDTIYGVDGIGKVGALKLIKQYGNIWAMIQDIKNKGTIQLKNELTKYKTWEQFNQNVKQTTWNKTELRVLFSQERLKIARQLKAMFNDLPVPQLDNKNADRFILQNLFDELQFGTIKKKVGILASTITSEQNKKKILNYFNVPSKYHCNNCNKDFMGRNLEKCPDCNQLFVKEQPKQTIVQESLF